MKAFIPLLALAATALAIPKSFGTALPDTATATTWNSADVTDPAAATDAPPVPNPTPGTEFPPVNATAATRGHTFITNKCPNAQYVYRCYQPYHHKPAGCTPEVSIEPGATHTEVYTKELNNGQSLKISPFKGTDAKPILQLEYTAASGQFAGLINWDVSEVNGNPYGSRGGFTSSATGRCARQGHKCPPPSTNCPGIFTHPSDGVPHYCPDENNVGVILCQS